LLKKQPGHTIVLAARLRLEHSTPEAVQAKMDTFIKQRHRTQPPGASMGSMFKNPPGDYAGRLIEAAGLKGTRVGDAVISPLHANFFINQGQATASDIRKLIDLARQSVAQQFGITLELEIELVGE
jgi:UDP-N-acetylmuramate dehydrogenase